MGPDMGHWPQGCKHRFVADPSGLSLARLLTQANVADSKAFELILDAVPPIHGPLGRRRRRAGELRADNQDRRRVERAAWAALLGHNAHGALVQPIPPAAHTRRAARECS